MDYTKDNIVKDKAKTWKSFNRLIIYTTVLVCIILVVILIFFNYPTISFSLKKNSISILAFSSESDP